MPAVPSACNCVEVSPLSWSEVSAFTCVVPSALIWLVSRLLIFVASIFVTWSAVRVAKTEVLKLFTCSLFKAAMLEELMARTAAEVSAFICEVVKLTS